MDAKFWKCQISFFMYNVSVMMLGFNLCFDDERADFPAHKIIIKICVMPLESLHSDKHKSSSKIYTKIKRMLLYVFILSKFERMCLR